MINRSARLLAIFLLLINGTGAMYGGWSLMTDPSGVSLGLPPDWISRIPFHDYLIPGVILFIVNGIFSTLAAIATISRSRGFEKFIIAQGALLTGWILVQILMLHTTEFLHIAMISIGLTMLVLGAILVLNRMHDVIGNHS
jgi:hypothetical protein